MVATVAPHDELRNQIQGQVILPGDSGYDQARAAWNLTVDQHPAVIVVAQGMEDVVASVQHARKSGLGVAVQSTGHGVHRPADGALLLVMSRMNRVRVDAAARTAWVEAGAKWGPVLEQAQALGLAPLLGSSPTVGVVGYTLGGGMGWLARKYGMAIDSVVRFAVVTPEGQPVVASETENPDLFWALRGGGGSFGIVTAMEIRLYPVTEIYGGNLYYPVDQAKEVFTRFREWITALPEEMTAAVVIMNFPPIPALPEFLRGRSFVMVRGCYCGPVEEGERLLAPWRAWQTPLLDDFKARPFAEVAKVSNDPVDPVPGYSTGAWVQELSDAAIDLFVQACTPVQGPSPITLCEVRHAGGAMARVDPHVAAYSHRDTPFCLHLVGIAPAPELYAAVVQAAQQLKQALRPALTGGVYVNFLDGEEARERTADAYSPEAYRRLAQIKAQVDPENRLAYSLDIPAGAGA